MSAVCFEGTTTNPEILAIADQVFFTVRLSIQRAAYALANEPSVKLPDKGIERSAYNFLKSYQTKDRRGVLHLAGISRTGRGRLDAMIAQPVRGLADVKLDAPLSIFEQAKANRFFSGLKLSPNTLADVKWDAEAKNFVVPTTKHAYAAKILEALAFKRVYPASATSPAPAPAPAKARELHLKLARLKAVRRFGWEITDWANDSIACGGDGVDSTQQHIKAPEFFIHEFKKDGESFDIRPDRTFVKFDLNRAGQWPRAFMATLFLAEKDASGGFIEFQQKLWEEIGDEVIAISTALASAALGGTIGAITGTTVAPMVGTIVGAVIGAVIGLLVSWVLDSLKDDIFTSPENPVGMILPSQESLFPGNSTKSATYVQDFTSGPSRYLMSYYWELVF